MEENNSLLFKEQFPDQSTERRPSVMPENASFNNINFSYFQPFPTQYFIQSNPIINSNSFGNHQVNYRESVPYKTFLPNGLFIAETSPEVQYTETPLGGLKFTSLDNLRQKNLSSNTNISTDVGPKRPSYSDVLTKSVVSNSFEINQKKPKVIQESIYKNNVIKKNFIPKPSNYTYPMLDNKKRHIFRKALKQHLAFINGTRRMFFDKNYFDQLLNNKKGDSEASKQWKKNLNHNNDENKKIIKNNFKDEKNKKNTSKIIKTKTFNKESNKNQETTNNQKRGSQKKDFEKKTFVTKPKFEAIYNKKNFEEKKVSWNDQKLSKKFYRKFQPEKHEKIVRTNRREQNACISSTIKVQLKRWGEILLFVFNWLFWLVLDVLFLSTYLALYMCSSAWMCFVENSSQMFKNFFYSIRNVEVMQKLNGLIFFFRKSYLRKLWLGDIINQHGDKMPLMGLKHNISLPQTEVQAIERILACDGKDAYSVLGVTHDCSDDDIKKYYKWQRFLINSKKSERTGAEEASKLLIRAFSFIGQPGQRKYYDQRPQIIYMSDYSFESRTNWCHEKKRKRDELFASIMRCSNCKKHHKKTTVKRPLYAARMCSQCKIYHSVREGDLWAETSMFGLLWRYYACMERKVYDVTEWAGCQRKNFKNFKANTHNVQTKLVKNLELKCEDLDVGC